MLFGHYKGGQYRWLFDAIRSEDHLTVEVVYVSLTNGRVFVRPRSEWEELVEWPDGVARARFEFLPPGIT